MSSTVALAPFPWVLCGSLLLMASWSDVRSRRVSNALSVSLCVVGLAARLLAGSWLAGLWGLGGAALGLALLLVPFMRGWIGGGDVKLLAALGAWFGAWLILEVVLASMLVGGIISIGFLCAAPPALRREIVANLLSVLFARRIPEIGPRAKQHSPPYAPAMALGAAYVLWRHADVLLLR